MRRRLPELEHLARRSEACASASTDDPMLGLSAMIWFRAQPKCLRPASRCRFDLPPPYSQPASQSSQRARHPIRYFADIPPMIAPSGVLGNGSVARRGRSTNRTRRLTNITPRRDRSCRAAKMTIHMISVLAPISCRGTRRASRRDRAQCAICWPGSPGRNSRRPTRI